jgi:hypothetical protein
VTGHIQFVGADCAETFAVAASDDESVHAGPGTVMVIHSELALRPSDREYDRCVAGIVSGAGDFGPALLLDSREYPGVRAPVALLGKVYCKVDARYSPIEVGDLLTTSPTLGHAMKATDRRRAPGAIVGKALRPLGAGRGLIPILVALQ